MTTRKKPARRTAPKRKKVRRKARTPAQIAKALKFQTITFPQFKRLSIANKVRFVKWNDPQGDWDFLASPSNRDHETLDGIAAEMF